MSPFFWLLSAISTVLLALVLMALVRRRLVPTFPFLFAYCLAMFLSDLLSWSAEFGVPIAPQPNETSYKYWYYANDAVHQFLMFCLVVSLIYRLTEEKTFRFTGIGAILASLSIIIGFSYYSLQSGEKYSRAMSLISRNLSFTSALLAMVIWVLIMKQGVRNPAILLIASGVGMRAAGKAIGQALRTVSPDTLLIGDLALVTTHIFCLMVWYVALRGPKVAVNLETDTRQKARSTSA